MHQSLQRDGTCECSNAAPVASCDTSSSPPHSPVNSLSNATSCGSPGAHLTPNGSPIRCVTSAVSSSTSPSRKRSFAALGGSSSSQDSDSSHRNKNNNSSTGSASDNSSSSTSSSDGDDRVSSPPPKTPHLHHPSHHHSSNPDGSINPTDLMLLKVIGRGTFAQQVALARHRRTQTMYVVKTLNKNRLVQRKQVSHTLTEKKVLQELGGHPFIVKLYSAFQTERDLNFVLEFCQGGELFYHLQQQKQQKFDEQATIFYAAEVLSALQELHAKGIVYRDLKPENVLLDAQGHVKLADFGFAKQEMQNGKRTFSFCGSPEYLSPEMVAKQGHGVETDMWSFGCFCYELLTGSPPFQGDNLERLFDCIQSGKVFYPPYLSGFAVCLLKQLLHVNPSQRLTATQAMQHGFFQSIDWTKLLNRQVAPPIRPVIKGCECTFNFDDGFTTEPVAAVLEDPPQVRQESDDFGDF